MKLLVILALLVTSLHSSQADSVPVKEKSYSVKDYEHVHPKGLSKTIESKHRMRAFPRVSYMDIVTPIPGSVDLSSQVSLPESQGHCGACWDFSLTKALRSEYMLQGMDPGQLEFNYLLNNCGPGPKMNGCNGGSFDAAQSFEYGAGPGLNSLNPFQGIDGGKCKKLAVKGTAISYSLLGEGNDAPTFKDLAYSVGVGRHVLSVDVAAASGDWERYSGGIYDHCKGGPADVDHMVNIVGFSAEKSVDKNGNAVFDKNGRPIKGDGYLIVMNNWGEKWGRSASNGKLGYMFTRMYDKRGNHCNAIATDALFFTIAN